MFRCQLVFVFLMFVHGLSTNVTSLLPDEQMLLDFILAEYDPSGRPVYNASHTVTVKFGFTLAQLSDMDEVNQVLTTNVWIEQEWEDERLIWNPKDYNGLETLRIPCEKIWLPDIVLYNSADDFTTGYMQSKAMVNYNGTVFWSPPAKLRSSCKIDITYFPFDDQVCGMKFGSWSYDGYQVDITNRSSFVDLENFVYSGEWELLGIDIVRNVRFYACCKEPFPDVVFTMKIRRKTLYYLFNVIFPCLWLSALSLLSFWLPPDTGEKITLGITVLLAFSVFMLLIAENMPATSEFVPLIGIYLTVTMGMTSLSIILTVFVLQIHHVGPHQKPIPNWLRYLAFRILGRCVCMYSDVRHGYLETNSPKCQRSRVLLSRLTSDYTKDSSNPRNQFVQHDIRDAYVERDLDSSCLEQVPLDHHHHQANDNTYRDDEVRAYHLYNSHLTNFCHTDSYKSKERRKRQPLRQNNLHRPYKSDKTNRNQGLTTRNFDADDFQRIVNEWHLIAIIIDRVLFWVFLCSIVVASICILVVLPLKKPKI